MYLGVYAKTEEEALSEAEKRCPDYIATKASKVYHRGISYDFGGRYKFNVRMRKKEVSQE